eukprot:6851727-Pyramimonas_sp.AAC.2
MVRHTQLLPADVDFDLRMSHPPTTLKRCGVNGDYGSQGGSSPLVVRTGNPAHTTLYVVACRFQIGQHGRAAARNVEGFDQ